MTESMLRARSARAADALALVAALQSRFGEGLEHLSARLGHPLDLERPSWLRDGGSHGGGTRWVLTERTPVFDRVAINVSQVHYDDLPERRLGSATALSTIIHPAHPRAPSVHMHFSYTEPRGEEGYWRVMADLNPSLANAPETSAAKEVFDENLRRALGPLADSAIAQGDKYFDIPAAGRRRGVSHYYLEQMRSGGFEAELSFVRQVAETAINTYLLILAERAAEGGEPTEPDRSRQLEYHTLYFFQVLSLDRGTTSGLLVHDQNDEGILGSLPSRVDPKVLLQWRERMPPPQEELLDALLGELGETEGPVEVDRALKLRLAAAVRAHYRRHPEAVHLQATGGIVPPTVANHEASR